MTLWEQIKDVKRLDGGFGWSNLKKFEKVVAEMDKKQLRLTNSFNSRKAGCLKQYSLHRNPGFSLNKCLFDY